MVKNTAKIMLIGAGFLLAITSGCEQTNTRKDEEKLRTSLQKPIRLDEMTPEQRKRVEPFLRMGQQGPPTSNPLAQADAKPDSPSRKPQ